MHSWLPSNCRLIWLARRPTVDDARQVAESRGLFQFFVIFQDGAADLEQVQGFFQAVCNFNFPVSAILFKIAIAAYVRVVRLFNQPGVTSSTRRLLLRCGAPAGSA